MLLLRSDRRRPRRLVLAAASAVLVSLLGGNPAAQTGQSGKPPIDYRVFGRMDRPVAGTWEFVDPIDGKTRRLELRTSPADAKVLLGVLLPEGKEILSIEPKSEGFGYGGELRSLLAPCGEDRVAVSDFLPLGDRAIVQIETTPPLTACPFLEGPPTARLFVGPTAEPLRLRAAGEISSERTREQIGLGGQRVEPPSPIVANATLVEGGTELKFLGRVRSLDGTLWIEVEGLVSPAPGIEPPRGYVLAGKIRVAATLALTRVKEPSAAVPR